MKRPARGRVVFGSVAVLLLGGSVCFPQSVTGKPNDLVALHVVLSNYGLPNNYTEHDRDDNCTDHVIGYRFVAWLASDSVAIGFNTSPACRPLFGQEVARGNVRLLVFDAHGHLQAKRDVAYSADGGDELVTSGEAFRGPENTLLLRIEEAHNSKSAVIVPNRQLKDVARFDRFMETASVIDHSFVFQEGTVLVGPRTYDIMTGYPPAAITTITQSWPTGTMARTVGENGIAYAVCRQELHPGGYHSTNIIYAGAHRRCSIDALPRNGKFETFPLQQDQVAEILGITDDGRVVSILRAPKQAEHLVIWSANGLRQELPWYPAGYVSELQSVSDDMSRYLGYGVRNVGQVGELMIFDRNSSIPIVRRPLSQSARAALSPDGQRYATFEAGELRIYSLPAER